MFEPANIISVLRNAPGNINGMADGQHRRAYMCLCVHVRDRIFPRFSRKHQRRVVLVVSGEMSSSGPLSR